MMLHNLLSWMAPCICCCSSCSPFFASWNSIASDWNSDSNLLDLSSACLQHPMTWLYWLLNSCHSSLALWNMAWYWLFSATCSSSICFISILRPIESYSISLNLASNSSSAVRGPLLLLGEPLGLDCLWNVLLNADTLLGLGVDGVLSLLVGLGCTLPAGRLALSASSIAFRDLFEASERDTLRTCENELAPSGLLCIPLPAPLLLSTPSAGAALSNEKASELMFIKILFFWLWVVS